ncbi:MAG: efflux RND transporter periplasmic adaptor subunit [Nannocystaceae bacterium]
MVRRCGGTWLREQVQSDRARWRRPLMIGVVAILAAMSGCERGTAPAHGVKETAAAPETPAQVWTCPMHPEVREASSETPCPTCKMKLEPVTLAQPATDEVAHWTCPMHPSIRAPEQSPCPLCGMDLTEVTASELATGAVRIDATRRQQFGITTSPVRTRALEAELELPGVVEWKERALHDVTMRAEGWVERLYVSEVGSTVERGDRLALIYSPDMYSAQREFLAARDSAREVTKIERLRLLGLTRAQISALDKRGEGKDTFVLRAPATGTVIDFYDVVDGTHLPAGTRVARIGSLDEVRVGTHVHERDVGLIAGEMRVVLVPPNGAELEGTVTRVESWVNPVTRRAKALVDVDNSSGSLMPGMTVRAFVRIPFGERLAIPVGAVIATGKRDIVFVDAGDGRLIPRDVELGRRAGEWYEVRGGLSEGDAVVSAGTFLVASESRMSASQSYWGRGDDDE